MTRDEIIEKIKEKIQDGLSYISDVTDPLHEAFDLLESAKAKQLYEPTASEISSYISAWDGDISEEEARALLREAHRILFEPPVGEFTKEVRPRFEAYKQERPTIKRCGNEWLDRVLDEAMCAVFEACRRLDAQQQKIAELGADKVQLENDACVARGEIERLNVQLAGCGVAAGQNTEDTTKDRVSRDSYGWSASYQDVCNAVDREMASRNEVDLLTTENKALTERIEKLCVENGIVRKNNKGRERQIEALIGQIKIIIAENKAQAERIKMLCVKNGLLWEENKALAERVELPVGELRTESCMKFLHDLLIRAANFQDMPTDDMCRQIEDICKGMVDVFEQEIERLKADAEGFVSSEHALTLSKEIDRLTAEKQAQAERVEKLEKALERIQAWAKAYPLDVFPKPDFIKAAEVLKAAGLNLDGISADNMRHVLEGLQDICKQALQPKGSTSSLKNSPRPLDYETV